MRAPTDAPRVRDYARMVRSRWMIIALAMVLSTATAWAATTFLVTPTYTSTARLFVSVSGTASTKAAFEGNRGALSRVETYVSLATSEQVLERAAAQTNLSTPTATLAKDILAVPTPGSALITITGTADSAVVAHDFTDAVATSLVEVVQELESSDAGTVANLQIVDRAEPATKTAPTLSGGLVVGLGMGLVISIILVIASALRADTLTFRDQVTQVLRTRDEKRRTDA